MKIDVTSIVMDHLSTLKSARSGRFSKADFATFFGFPVVIFGLALHCKFHVDKDAYNVSITFFGIFIALLLNIQVAIFSIFQRKWAAPTDQRLAQIQERKIAERREILSQLNANISYLVLFCCLSLILFLMFFVWDWDRGIAPAISVLVYSHFILTLVMVVKRSHALFQKEYRDSPD